MADYDQISLKFAFC